MAVYFEILRLLRGDPEREAEFRKRGGEDREAQVDAWLERLKAEGAFRDDVRAGRYPSAAESYAAAPEKDPTPEKDPCAS